MEKNWYEQEDLGLKLNWEWLDKLIDFTKYLVKIHHPDNQVSLEMFSREPGDMLFSIMDNEMAYLAIHDHPEELKELLKRLAIIHIEWSEKQLEAISRLEKGY